MYISARERQIIELLINNPKGLTVEVISETIGVSSRTIHRELKNIENTLSSFQLALVKKAGTGVYIEGEEHNKNHLQISLLKGAVQEFTPKERQILLLCTLLKEREPVKLISLAQDLHVTVATISNDLGKAEELIAGFELELVRRKGHGIEIQGSEKEKRKALGNIIVGNLNEYEFLETINQSEGQGHVYYHNEVTNKLLEIVKLERMAMVSQVLSGINNKLTYAMTDSAYVTFVVHLTLAVERIIQEEKVTIDNKVLAELKESKEYPIAQQIAKELEEVFNIVIPEAECGYITMHLQGARFRYEKTEWSEEEDLRVAVSVKELIRYVSHSMNIDFQKDASLFEGLLTHIRPALNRIRKSLGTHNPLTEKIKADYEVLYSKIEEGLKEVFSNTVFPEDEIAFIVLHFGSAMETHYYNGEIKALVICSSGIGSSKMLASRIRKELKEVTYVDVSSLSELKKKDLAQYDIILSTIQMPGFTREYLLVNPLLTNAEVQKIRNQLKIRLQDNEGNKNLFEQYTVPKIEQINSIDQMTEMFNEVQQLSESIVQILQNFRIQKIPFSPTLSTVLTEVCKQTQLMGLLTNYFEVSNKLLEREKRGGLGIPNTAMGLFHCRSKFVKQPTFLIFTLVESIPVKAMDHTTITLKTVLLLLSPESVSEYQLEVLSTISSTIIENEQTLHTFDSENYNAIYAELGKAFKKILKEKI
ncbi:BglG family transcription antiterminator [Ectobacillus panaciterrae]|uniref:BglG family transcription antiterminator n=1 Tax=Ectobacillus panaciterrae TaxID=363872 RepID=UPI00041D6968|nr:BglG family transcription antiterminator [Ectobacillus panaciterrae]